MSRVFRPRSSEFVAVNVPEPVVVMLRSAPQTSVDAPLEKLIVAMLDVMSFERRLIGSDDVPVQVTALDIVVVAEPGSIRLVPAAIDSDANVLPPKMRKVPLDVLADMVTSPRD